MKIACVILGTRGDVQPMVALATGLMKKGHEVTIFAPPENESWSGNIIAGSSHSDPTLRSRSVKGLKNRREALLLQSHLKRERSLSEIR
jgi:UDP:flavonoid glycosyltransferase YjiC (YdhE family)